MNREVQNLEGLKERNASVVSLDIGEDYLADIIVNFLGAKEKLTFKNDVAFIVGINDLEQFHYLLEEKIEREQYAHVNNFIVTVSYDDKTSRSISSIKALKVFLETRSVSPKQVTLEWHIVLSFPRRKIIETQKIELSFSPSNSPNHGYIRLVINHTNQAWGIEILNLFKNKLDEISIETPSIVRRSKTIIDNMIFSNYMSVVIVILLISSLLLASGFMSSPDTPPSLPKPDKLSVVTHSLIEGIYSGNKKEAKEYEKGLFLLKNVHLSQLETSTKLYIKNKKVKTSILGYVNGEYEEIDKKKKKILEDNEAKLTFTGVLWRIIFYAGILPFLSLYWLPKLYLQRTIIYYGTKSFLLLTPSSEKNYKTYLRKKRKVEYYTMSALLFAVVAGLITTVIMKFWF